MEENVETVVNIEASAFVETPAVAEQQQSGETVSSLSNFELYENIPILPADGREYHGLPVPHGQTAVSYFIDVSDPAMYTVEVKFDHIPNSIPRMLIFLSHDFNRPLVDGGNMNTTIQTFMHQTRYRLVVHGIDGAYTISVTPKS